LCGAATGATDHRVLRAQGSCGNGCHASLGSQVLSAQPPRGY
jgi:hypothetical protein